MDLFVHRGIVVLKQESASDYCHKVGRILFSKVSLYGITLNTTKGPIAQTLKIKVCAQGHICDLTKHVPSVFCEKTEENEMTMMRLPTNSTICV